MHISLFPGNSKLSTATRDDFTILIVSLSRTTAASRTINKFGKECKVSIPKINFRDFSD